MDAVAPKPAIVKHLEATEGQREVERRASAALRARVMTAGATFSSEVADLLGVLNADDETAAVEHTLRRRQGRRS